MNREQALAMLERIQQEAPCIRTTFDESQARDGHGYQVKLHLAQREFRVNSLKEWKSIKHAWIWFLQPEETIEVSPRSNRPAPAPRYLVGNIVMRIRQLKKGYWIGSYQRNGKTVQQFFGKQDPRPNYPLVEEEDKAS